jgi:glycosyltransferase involved in cell wall biosynthesis
MSYKAELEKFKPKRAEKKLKLYRYIYNNEKIITVAKAIIEDFNKLDIKYKTATTIYNPFDFEEIREKGNEIIDIKYDYIISPSAFREQKRYDVMLDAFALIKNDIKLLILAKIDNTLQHMINSRGLENRVKILGFQQNPYKYIKNAKLLVLSSDREGLPTVIIESLILGTPVVSTDCPTGPKEILVDNLANWLTQMNNPDKLAEKIDSALKQDIKIDNKILEKFHKDYIYKEYAKLCLN